MDGAEEGPAGGLEGYDGAAEGGGGVDVSLGSAWIVLG